MKILNSYFISIHDENINNNNVMRILRPFHSHHELFIISVKNRNFDIRYNRLQYSDLYVYCKTFFHLINPLTN